MKSTANLRQSQRMQSQRAVKHLQKRQPKGRIDMVKAMATAAVEAIEGNEGTEAIEGNDAPQVGIFDENAEAEQSSLPPDDESFGEPSDEPPVIDEANDDPAAEDATDLHDESADSADADTDTPEARYEAELR